MCYTSGRVVGNHSAIDASKHLEFVLKDMVLIRDLNTEFHSEADCVRVRKQFEQVDSIIAALESISL
jgi:hypothetical protein